MMMENGGIEMENRMYFKLKLQELDNRYALLRKEMNLDVNASHEELKLRLNHIGKISENDLKMMEAKMKRSNSKAVAVISEIQKEYSEKMNEIIQYHMDLWMSGKDELELKMEEMMLYAEFAIDHMMQTMNQTTLAMLRAVDLQMTYEERENEQ